MFDVGGLWLRRGKLRQKQISLHFRVKKPSAGRTCPCLPHHAGRARKARISVRSECRSNHFRTTHSGASFSSRLIHSTYRQPSTMILSNRSRQSPAEIRLLATHHETIISINDHKHQHPPCRQRATTSPSCQPLLVLRHVHGSEETSTSQEDPVPAKVQEGRTWLVEPELRLFTQSESWC